MFKFAGRVVVVALLVMAFAAPSFATTARTTSLAVTGDYINDDSNIFRWYGVLPSYANLVMAEVGSYVGGMPYDQALGVTNACGEDDKYGTWGLFLIQDHVGDNSYFGGQLSPIAIAAPSFAGVGVPVNKFVLAWGKEFNGFSLGLNFTRSDNSVEDETVDPVEKSSASYTTIGAGVRTDVGEDAYADIAFTLGFAGAETFDPADPATKIELDKKMMFDIAGRLFYEWKDYVTLVPLFHYFQYDYAFDRPTISPPPTIVDPIGEKTNALRFGLAMNVDVNTNNLLIVGLEIDRLKEEYSDPGSYKDEDQVWALPIFGIALESHVKPWLTARVGALKALVKYTNTVTVQEDPTDPTTWTGQDIIYTDALFAWFLGCGFHIAEFDIDCELSPALPFNMGYWLTGNSWTGMDQPIGKISAVYHY